MSAPSGWWQTGPGGVAGNLLASLIFAGGQMVVTAWRKVPDSADQALDAAGLHVAAGTIEKWLKNPATQRDLARIVPRDWLPDSNGRLDQRAPDPATPGALDDAASALRSAAGKCNQWTPAQANEALTVVLIVMLSSDQACRDRLTAARTEIIAENSLSLLEKTLDSIAWLAEVAVDTLTTARKTLEEVRGLRQHLDGSGLPSLDQLQTRHLRNNRPRATQFLTGREELIAQVAEALASSSRITFVALQGIGGVGKSTIAAEYCNRYDDSFDIIWWIRAGGDLRVGDATADAMRTTATSLIDDLANLGLRLGVTTTDDEPTTRARKALDALASIEQRWLLVYDSANHPEAINAWLPSQGNGQVIVTSRSPEITEIARMIEVACFDKLTGAELLRARCVGRNQLAAADGQTTDAQALSLYLGGHPLALAQAGAYVASSSRNRFGTYLLKLQANLAGELGQAPRPAGYPDPAHRAFLTSIAAAENSHPLAGRLLLALAFIEPDLAFPFELLEAFADGDFLKARPGDVEGAISALAAYAVIAEDQGHPIVHRLVQAAALERQPGDACAAQSWLCAFLPGILGAAKDGQTLHIAHLLQPHALRMLSGPAPAVERWKVLNANATATLLRGDPRAAVELFEQALVLVPDECDPNNRDARTNLAASYREAGRIQDAIAIQEPLLAQYERCIGPRDAETLSAHINLANSYLDAQRMEDAIAAYERVCEARSEVFGPTDDRTIAAQASLAFAYNQDGRSREAIDILEPIVQLDQLKDAHRAIAAGSALASSYEAIGRTDGSMELTKKIYAQSAEHFGSEHLTTLNIALNLALRYARNRRLDEALVLQMSSAEELDIILGTDHPKALLACANLAAMFITAGQSHEARRLLESVVLRSQANPNVAPADLTAWIDTLDQLVTECAEQ